MKVKELIKLLESVDPDRLVILQKDGEGNGFSPLCDVYTGAYTLETSYSGEVYLEELTDELREQGFGEEDVCIDGEKAVVMCPTN